MVVAAAAALVPTRDAEEWTIADFADSLPSACITIVNCCCCCGGAAGGGGRTKKGNTHTH